MKLDDISRRRLLSALGVSGAAGLAGCTGNGGDGGGGGGGANLEESATLGFASDPTSSFWRFYGGVGPYRTRVLEPLIWVNRDFTLEPWLATEWEQTSDLLWEFTIRDGVKFHNGDTLTADHVVFSMEKLVREFPQARFTWRFATEGEDPHVPKVKALDDRTVQFETRAPFPVFDAGIAHNMVAIQHPETDVEEHNVVATGPFQVDEIEPEQHVKVSAFDDYWQEPAKTENLTYRPILDPNTRFLALQNNDVDMAFNPPRNKYGTLQNADGINVIKQLAPRWGIINLNINNPPTDDVKLRRALDFAIDQKAIVESVLNDIGQPARAPIGKIISWSAHEQLDQGPWQDKEKAKQLVEESSYDDETVDFRITNNPQASWAPVNGQEIAEVVQHQAKEVGVNVEINAAEYSAFTDAWSNQEGNMYLFEWGTKSGAADYMIFKYHSRENTHHTPSDEFDKFVEQGETATTLEAKKEAYVNAQEILIDQGVVLPIYYKEYLVGLRDDIEGFEPHPLTQMSEWRGLKHLQK